MRHFLALFVATTIMSFVLCISIVSAAYTKTLLLVGGNLSEDNPEFFDALRDAMRQRAPQTRSTKNSEPSELVLSVITAASETPEDSASYYAELFDSKIQNVRVQWLPVSLAHIDMNRNPRVLQMISESHGIFIGGGDQDRLVRCFFEFSKNKTAVGKQQRLGDSPALSLIRARYLAGDLVLSGTSAGTAIMQQTPMVNGGESYEALRDGAQESGSHTKANQLTYDPLGGFGFFTSGFLDTHFSQRGRQARLVRLMLDTVNKGLKNAVALGFGVDEDTILHVEQGLESWSATQMRVLGQGGVFFFNTTVTRVDGLEAIRNVSVSYLTNGDTIKFTKAAEPYVPTHLQPAPWKSPLQGREHHEQPMSPSHDIFSSYRAGERDVDSERKDACEFVRVSADLFDSSRSTSTQGYTYENKPTFVAYLERAFGIGFEGVTPVYKQSSTCFWNLQMTILRQN